MSELILFSPRFALLLPLIHVIICFNSLILVIHMDLVAALGGIPGAFFLLSYPFHNLIFHH